MELIVEVRRAGADPADLVFEVEPAATFGDLADSLALLASDRVSQLPLERATLTIERTGQTPRRDDRVVDVDVRSGDRLHLVDAVNAAFSATPHAFGATLVVTSTSGAQTEYPLRYGENTIGRDLDNDVVIKDQQASRHHARITVDETLTITDLGSKNGVVIDGQAISGSVSLRVGRVARIGDLALTVTDHLKAVEAVASRNRVEFNRPPRITRPYAGREFEFPAPPSRPRKQRIPMLSAFLPVVFGLVMLTLFPSFGVLGVAFMMLSPVLLLGSYIEAKRNGHFDFKDQLAEHRESVEELVEQLEGEKANEITSRFFDSPAANQLAPFTRSLSPRLWERAPEDPDFLSVRVGTAALPSRNVVKIADGGARDLRKELDEIPPRFRTLEDVPLSIPLLAVGGLGLSGPLAATRALARSVVLQAATMHSPADLAIVALVGDDSVDEWTFVKWLPHARTLGGSQLASTSHHALGLVDALLSSRTPPDSSGHRTAAPGEASVLVVIDETCPVERRRLMPLLESGRHLGIAFVWVASASHRLPKGCGSVVDIAPDRSLARTGFTDSGATIDATRWEGMALADAEAAARLLTPVIDVTGRINDDSEIPSRVGFAELYGGEHMLDDPGSVLELWQQQEHTEGEGGLRVVAGMQSGAPFVLDIRQDGPHALVAGTTGAGKSEFLQSLIVGLATMHSPERVTFLLVDYKGGAAFKECVELPHTVGMVTDLDRNEVRRALTSLNAELHHRELLLQKADAKDLLEMERKGHPETPPSLLIVVDEFAALAKEVPEFVDGVVDVALRGRSLGLHLVLATQRPAGVITGQIRANTNLRIALRMAADDESADVVGSPVAAAIDRRLPGRGVARIGPQELIGFQSAYVGGHTLPNVQPPMVRPRWFGFDHDTEIKVERRVSVPKDHPSDLQRLIVTHRGAFDLLGVPIPRKPWLPSLSASYSLGRLPASPSDASILIGVEDQPERQIQTLASWRPDSDGGLIVLGTGGSGKTVALRTLAVSAGIAAETSGEPVEVYGIDFAGRGLDMLEALPHVGSVISGDDTERVTRLLRMLRERMDQRAAAFAEVRASSLPEYRRNAPDAADAARIIVLLDSYPGFLAAHERIEAGRWLDLYTRLVAEGRGVGVHFVITADRRNSVPTAIVSSIPRIMTLRLANDDEYLSAGEPVGILSPQSPPGRGISDGKEVQLAVLGGSGNGERQATEIATLAERLSANGVRPCPPVGTLPLEVWRSTLTVPSTESLLVAAIGDNDLAPRGFQLEHGHIVVGGPPRSGRTTALASIAQAAASAGIALFHLHVRPTPLANAPFWAKVARGPEEGATLLRKLQEVAPRFERRVGVVVDDLHELADSDADEALAELVRAVRELPVTIVAAVENQAGRRQYSGAIPDLRKDGTGFLLQPDIDVDGDLLGVPLPRGTKGPWAEGRGFFVSRGVVELAQVALPDPW